VAVASAGLYASLHLTPDNHDSTPPLSFLQAGCSSCRPTNSVKALKANQSNEGELDVRNISEVSVQKFVPKRQTHDVQQKSKSIVL